jgi:hypothetical protein
MRTAIAAGAGALLVLLSACGLGDSGFEEYGDEDGRSAIAATTTTSTTTTTTTTVPVVPSTVPGATTTTTTTTPIQTQPIEFYWVVESTGQILVTVIPLSEPTPQLLVLRLEQGPPLGEASVGLDTNVMEGLVLGIDVTRGIATVDLSGEILEQMPRTDPPLAIAQLVLTLTRFQGIGQVLFTRDGVPIDVPLPPNDELSPLGEPVAFEDFEILLVASQTATTTTTTAAPPDTEPPATTDGPVDTGP